MSKKSKIIFGLFIVGIVAFMIWGHKSTKNKVKEEEIKVNMDEVMNLQVWNDGDGEIYRGLEYQSGLSYNLYVPTNIDKSKDQSVILFLHGGSWEGGSKEDIDQVYCKVFAKAGYITAAMDYSFVNNNRNSHIPRYYGRNNNLFFRYQNKGKRAWYRD